MPRFVTTETGYVFDRLIFGLCLFLVVVLVLTTMMLNRFDFSTNIYFDCDQAVCPNPFYNMANCQQELKVLWVIPVYKTKDCFQTNHWSRQEFLLKGEYGKKPQAEWLLNNMGMVALCLLVSAFLINHAENNKGKTFDIEIPITKHFTLNRRKLKEWQDEKDKNISDK